MERLIDIVIFLAERNLAFRGSNKTLGSPHNGNFLGLLEQLAKRNFVLNELQNRTIRPKSKPHYFDKDFQNKLINLLAKEAEKVLLTQLKQAKYFTVILDCTPNILREKQLTVILRSVQCDNENGAKINGAFGVFLGVNERTGKGLLNVFLKQFKELGLNLPDCRGQSYNNGACMRDKEAGL